MIGFCGNLAIGKNASNGQTIKTRIILQEMERNIPKDQINLVDTAALYEKPVSGMLRLIRTIVKAQKVVILPAYRAIIILAALLFGLRKEKNVYYVVIGGWLPEMLKKKRWLLKRVSQYAGVYVETQSMQCALHNLGLKHVFVLPNCKPKKIARNRGQHEKYKFCTFSRVSKEKGVELAIEAVKRIRARYQDENITLDIYGKPDEEYARTFSEICGKLPPFIRYQGVVSTEMADSILSDYYALLFPTFYHGEGFPGTVIDAFAAGLPVIASDWKYNSEIVENDKTGFIVASQNLDALVEAIDRTIRQEDFLEEMRVNCKMEAAKFLPANAMAQFLEHLKKVE